MKEGKSPLGDDHCFQTESKYIFSSKLSNGNKFVFLILLFCTSILETLQNIVNEWQVKDIINLNNDKISEEIVSNLIIEECIHEDMLQNRGTVTKFRRTTDISKKISRNFLIMSKRGPAK